MADDMVFMQQEAARRVHRMQEHSRRVFEEHQERAPEPPAVRPPAKNDTEQWMLLGLALLLFRSGCRPELAAALLYLAL